MQIRHAFQSALLRVEERTAAAREKVMFRNYRKLKFDTSQSLVTAHFSTWSEPDHPNLGGFAAALQPFQERPLVIVETGTSAWGTDSTRLWDAYVTNFGGEFWSVDISKGPKRRLQRQVGTQTHLIVGDSIEFLKTFAANGEGDGLDVVYLDSWDLDWDCPEPAEEHGLHEWHAIQGLLKPGSVLIIDDTPASLHWVPEILHEKGKHFLHSRGFLPGKGALIARELEEANEFTKLWHGYNLVYRKKVAAS